MDNIRITEGEQFIWNLGDNPISHFLTKFDKEKDIFFLKDNETAIESVRMSNLTFHGKKGDFHNLDKVKFVYAGYEKEFYTSEDFSTMIKSIYRGRRNNKIKPLHL